MRIVLLAWLLAGSPDAGVKPIAVDNRALFDAFTANEVAANKRYKNQIVQVTGIISAVEEDEGIVFRLATRNRFMSTYAALETAAAAKDDRIEKLTPGDRVIITCVCVGKNQGVPVLGGCVLDKAFRHPTE